MAAIGSRSGCIPRGEIDHTTATPPGIHHLALRAKSREDVDELYRVLLKIKAEILEVPREYPEYEPGYYAVFFLDPDGIKLEFVFTNDRD